MSLSRARTLNRQILVGELAAVPEMRAMANGDPVANLRVITYDEYRDRSNNNEVKEVAETHRVVVFGKPAEELRELKKGAVVYVEGRTKVRRFQQPGSTEPKFYTEVSVSIFEGRCFAIATEEEPAVTVTRPPARQASAPNRPPAEARPDVAEDGPPY